ncbi:hypothetical protein RJT34_00180 [Clitoria ternatea]|uniref:non-specific serine/threonine protein kinase n=1 Tax=Clitoria ternatea TaxID=43366 RepID=A0AAN9PZ55_CLITE
MATAAKNVVVIQDASKVLNLRVFHWITNGLSLHPADMVTLISILRDVHTPMGYKIPVDNRAMIGANQKIIENVLIGKKEEYLQNEELAQIAKLFESNEVAFKIRLCAGSSPREVVLREVRNQKAAWLVLDRQMKKDEEFFLQTLSCGISIIKSNNRILRLRGPLDLPVEIPCDSHDSYDGSLPSNPNEDPISIDVLPKSILKNHEQNQIQHRPRGEEESSTFTTNIGEKPCKTSPYHQILDDMERYTQCQGQEQKQSMPHERERDTTLVLNNDQIATDIANQSSQDEETANNFFHDEKGELRHPTKSEEIIDQTKDDLLLCQNGTQILSFPHGQQENCILEDSMCTFCPVCKTTRPNIESQKEFTYEELQSATDGFSLKNCLSESGHLFTFKGQLEGQQKIVVKQHEITNAQVREKMKLEIQTILKARHKNVIILLGSSTREHFHLTVYEHACNGSLDKYLSKESDRRLIWIERERVAMGLARGLKYLHDSNIVHGNVKPSNILLTHDFKPLLGDFNFGKKHDLKSYKSKSTGVCEYIAPECLEKGKLTTKTDVYSFGVVILELITGRRMISEDRSLVEWAKPLLKGKKYPELVDPIIRNSYEEDHLRWLVKVIAQCLKKNPKERMSMNMVVSALQGIADSDQCHIREDITPAISSSTIVPDINGSQGPIKADQPSQEEEQPESNFDEEGRKLTLTVERNHYYTINQMESDKQNQIEEQVQSRHQEKERRFGKLIISDEMMDQTVVDHLSEFEEYMTSSSSTLHREGTSTQKISINHMTSQRKLDQLSPDPQEERNFVEMKIGSRLEPISGTIDQTDAEQLIQGKTQLRRSSNENLLDGHQGERILENSNSSACSICKSRRPNFAWREDLTYDELLGATEGFSIENSLSEREDGPTFKGLLESGVKIVVKKHQITRPQEEKMFKSEAKLLINAGHKHVVMLLGLCTDKSQLMVVYEQVCNGSLDQYLTKGSFQSLTWMQRLRVAIGTARGLKYLHGLNIIHGNIKPSNILLTHDFEPLIGDFRFGKVKSEPKTSSKDKSARNFGYEAPEYSSNGKLSSKIDVYSFGVVLLELITGRKATDKLPGGKSLVGWARPLLGGKKYPQLVDPKISDSYEENKLRWLVQVTEQCLRKNPKDRFTMNMVSLRNAVSALQGIAESAECCITKNSSPETSYVTHDEHAMASSQGKMNADPACREQEQSVGNLLEEERRPRLAITRNHNIDQSKADQLRQDEEQVQNTVPVEEMSGATILSNDMTYRINSDQHNREEEHAKGIFHLEEMDKKLEKQQKASMDKSQIHGSFDEDLVTGNERKIILENSKASVCSVCKSRRPSSKSQKKFTYDELQAATEGFSIKYSLSEGEYGPAFRGQLDNNLEIVIKQHEFTSSQEQKVFMTEFQLLINARHENVIMLLGSCIRKTQSLIVYEQACNGSLDHYLSRASGRSLTWRERVKVAIGVARGLKYLHENNVVHGKIKPSNILLNHEFKPLLGDFVFGKERCESKNKSLQRCGYTAPESYESGKLSMKADVYSFGVVLLELITGYMITDIIPGQKCLVEWARTLLGTRKYLQLVDPKISNSYDEQELVSMVQVTEKCLRKNPKERFTMNMVVSTLPCAVDNNGIDIHVNVNEDFSAERSNVICNGSDATNSKGEEESLEEEEEDLLGTENGEGREDNNMTSSTSNSETELCEKSNRNTTSAESTSEETEEKERLSGTKACQKWEGCLSYGGAREFYLEGAQEYAACQEFFGWCNLN